MAKRKILGAHTTGLSPAQKLSWCVKTNQQTPSLRGIQAQDHFKSIPPAAQPSATIRALSRVVRFFLPILSRALSRLIRVDNRVWVFGLQEMQGVYEFVDNSKYLFLAVANSSEGTIRPIWISWTPRLAIMLRNMGYEAYWIGSARGLSLALRAGCIFSHGGHGGVMQRLISSGKALRVELWHGIPLKALNLQVNADYVVGTSESLRSLFAACLPVSPSRVIVSGYPRNDVLLKPMKGHDIGVGDLLNTVRELKKSGRIVLYAPTFRDNLLVPAEEFLRYLGFDMARLDAVLTKHGAYVIMKFHHLVRTTKSSHRFAKISQRVHIISDPIDVYPILSQADVLVTDYSSVFFDFLLLDRPIVFYVPDYDTYLRERGFCLDFDSFTPGPKAKSFEQLLLALDDILIGADRFAEQRKRVREYAFDNVDGLSSERLLGSVMKIVHLRKA